MATPPNVEEIEIKLLLEGVVMRYGYDFREYAVAPLKRSIASGMAGEGVATISAYQERLLHDASCMQRFLSGVGVNVTSMFREADVLRCIRDEVIPRFRTYPSLRIWIAGCATGEEVYSMAIMLKEEGLYERSRIYATDLNEDSLVIAFSAGKAHPIVIRAMKLARHRRAKTLAITDATLSEVGEHSDLTLYYSSNSPSFTRSNAALLAIVLWPLVLLGINLHIHK
jgi:hypothetical protein